MIRLQRRASRSHPRSSVSFTDREQSFRRQDERYCLCEVTGDAVMDRRNCGYHCFSPRERTSGLVLVRDNWSRSQSIQTFYPTGAVMRDPRLGLRSVSGDVLCHTFGLHHGRAQRATLTLYSASPGEFSCVTTHHDIFAGKDNNPPGTCAVKPPQRYPNGLCFKGIMVNECPIVSCLNDAL